MCAYAFMYEYLQKNLFFKKTYIQAVTTAKKEELLGSRGVTKIAEDARITAGMAASGSQKKKGRHALKRRVYII